MNNETHVNSSSSSTVTAIHPGRAALWASAFVLAALVVLQAGKLPGNPAYAEGVSNGTNYTLFTVDSGRGGGDEGPDQVVVVIDNRNATLMAYVADRRTNAINLLDGGSLDVYFRNAISR
jgi:hypothetical protein